MTEEFNDTGYGLDRVDVFLQQFVFSVSIRDDLLGSQLPQEVFQNLRALAALENKIQLFVAGFPPHTFQEYFPSQAMRRMAVDDHSVHIEHNPAQHTKRLESLWIRATWPGPFDSSP